jgi:hypothetical protein
MRNRFKFHKHDKIWVRRIEGKFEYFNIVEWRYLEYTGVKSGDNFCGEADFAEREVRPD